MQAPADLEAMLARADAALLIGDPALHVDRGRYRVLDLAAEWRRLTGRAVRLRRLGGAGGRCRCRTWRRPFRDSLALGEAEMDELIGEAVAETGLGPRSSAST